MKKTFNCLSLLLAAAVVLLSSGCSHRASNLPRAAKDAAVEAAVDSFVQATVSRPQAPDYITLHSVMLLQHGKVIAERWLNGAAPDSAHVMHSVSKTFVAAAAGLAISEGRMALEDKVISFFPDKTPEQISDTLASMSVRDLLTMTCGHQREASPVRKDTADWVKGFLAWPVEHVPGEFFAYNSLGTYMVSAIIQEVTGEKAVDYLNPRLFEPLGIEKPLWLESPQGINCGGWGLYLKTEDMAKMGQLLLDGGVWKGRQIMDSGWVREMMSVQVPTDRPGDTRADWTQGYGYFMWMCSPDGARADGSEGQYILVLPKYDAVIVLTTESTLYQPYLDIVWEYLLPVFGKRS